MGDTLRELRFPGHFISVAIKNFFLPGVVLFSLWATTALADTGMKPKIPSGIYPAFSVEYDYDDNIYRLENDVIQDDILVGKPSLTWKQSFNKGKEKIEASYFAEIYRYREIKGEDKENQYFDAKFIWEMTNKLKLELGGDYANAYESRGASGTRVGRSNQPDAWWADRIFGELTYGRRSSRNQIVLNVQQYRRRYTNNEQQPRSRDRVEGTVSLYHNRKSKSQFVLQGHVRSFDYFDKTAPIDLTSMEYNIDAGVTWEVTGKTKGKLLIGWLMKDLEDSEIPDFAGFSVESEMSWKPKTYSEFILRLARSTKESPHTIASYYVSSNIALDWEHDWTKKINTLARVSYVKDNYETINKVSRDDDLLDISVEVNYFIFDWLQLGARYLNTNRSSTFDNIDYKANVFMLSLTVDTMESAQRKAERKKRARRNRLKRNLHEEQSPTLNQERSPALNTEPGSEDDSTIYQ